jgi:hypothetical protein
LTPRLPLRTLAVFAALALVVAGPALLQDINQAWDHGPSRTFGSTVADKWWSKGQGWHLTLKGAPELPTANNTMDVSVSVGEYNAAPGDSVFVVVKPGFFHRSWIVSYRMQTAQDRVQELQERHHSLNGPTQKKIQP